MDTNVTPLFGNPPTELDAQIGRIVEMLLSLVGVHNAELAARLGISPQAMSSKLKGKRPWSATEIKATADALGFPTALLYADPSDVTATLREPGRSINYRSSA